MTQEEKQLLAGMANSPQGRAFRSLLKDCLEEIGDVDKCESWEDTLGRKYAKTFLCKAFDFLEEKPEPKTNRSQYT